MLKFIERFVDISSSLVPGKVLIVYGPRRAGKTTLEERDGGLFGFECKWAPKQRVKPPNKWQESYPGATFELVTPDNYLDFAG